MTLDRARRWGALLALSLGLGWVLEKAAFPAALLVGPMITAILFGVNGAGLRVPRPPFIAAQAIIGCLVAQALTASILISIAQDWAPMLVIVALTVLAGGIVGWVLVKFGVLPGSTAAWGSSPGAASAMIVMSEQYGADVRLVAFMQYLRVIIVVLTASLVSRLLLGADHVAAATAAAPSAPLPATPLPSLIETLAIAGAGAFAGWRLPIPAGALLVPMTVGATLHTTGIVQLVLPPWLLAIAYTVVGWYVGLSFTRDVLRYALRAIPRLLLATFMLIGLCALSAWACTRLLHTDALTAYLATSPGGLDSVAIIAVGSHVDVAFVLAVQTLRLFIVILTGPRIAKLISRYA